MALFLLHLNQILEILFAFHAFACLITVMTKTPKDDEILGKIYKVIDFVALNVGYAKDR